MKHLRLIALWLLMLTIPVQGLAAFAPSAGCAEDHAGRAAPASHDAHAGHQKVAEHGHDHPAAPATHQHDDGQPADQTGGHSCCHHAFSAATQSATPAAPHSPHAATPRVSLLTTLYIPELPQRPPRA